MIVRLVFILSFPLLAVSAKLRKGMVQKFRRNCNKGRNIRRALLILCCGLYFARLPETSSDEPGKSGQQTEHREHSTKAH